MAACCVISRPFEFEAGRREDQLALEERSFAVFSASIVVNLLLGEDRRMKDGEQQLPRWVGREPVRVRVGRTKTSRAACSPRASSNGPGCAIIPASAEKTPSMPRQ